MKVLIIEDNPADARLAREFAGGHGVSPKPEVLIASRLAEGIQRLQAERFDVVLADLSLPDARGREVFDAIARTAPRIPVIVLSGNEDEATAVELVAGGAQDYLNKSDLTERIMRRSIVSAIERKALEENLKEKNRALAEAQEELIYLAKMETTGHFAAGVAHEVKNPLAVIQLGIDTLSSLNGPSPDEVVTKCLERMQTALDRADGIIRELLDFSSDRTLQGELGDLHEAVNRAVSLVHPQLATTGIELACEFAESLPPLRMDRRKIEQAVINLLLNCQHALRQADDRRIAISTRWEPAAEGGEGAVCLVIEDSGSGIPREEMPRVFDAFYTTKQPDEGTGLGLTVVQMIVQLHEANIALSRGELGGLAVTIRFSPGRNEERRIGFQSGLPGN